MMATTVADLVATLRMDAGQFNRTAEQVSGQAQSMGAGFGRLGTAVKAAFSVAVIKQVVDFGAAMYKVGVESEAMGLRYRAVFGQNTAELDRWIDENRAAFGMARDDMQGFVANVTNMLTPLGMTTAEAGRQTTKILELANAWSVWSGGQVSSAQAAESLTKGILGQTRGLVELGMKITEEEVAAKLAAAGVENLTGLEKVRAEALARMELIQERSNAALRVYDEAMGGAAGAQRRMQTAMAEMKDAIGAMVVELSPLITLLAKLVGFTAGLLRMSVSFGDLNDKVALFGAAMRADESELADFRKALRDLGMDDAVGKLGQAREMFQQADVAVNALVNSLQGLRNALLNLPGNVSTSVSVTGTGAGPSTAVVGGYLVKNPQAWFSSPQSVFKPGGAMNPEGGSGGGGSPVYIGAVIGDDEAVADAVSRALRRAKQRGL